MPRIVSFLDTDTIKNIKELYKDPTKPLSRIVSELVMIGYKVKQHQEHQPINSQEQTKNLLTYKHTEYLLRIMAIASDTYRCIRNEKSKYQEENVDDALLTIATNTQNYINSKANNDDKN